MTPTLDNLRRAAKTLGKAYRNSEPGAAERLAHYPPRAGTTAPKHADFLHVIARENNFASWPDLKLAVETHGMAQAAKQQRLKLALMHGQNKVVDLLLDDTPDLAEGLPGLQAALYDLDAVRRALADDPECAFRQFGPRTMFQHLTFSRYIHAHPEKEQDMLAIAELLLAHGVDINAGYPAEPGSPHMLSPLFGALGHADNMVLAGWLLERGADPNDGESLYHATELGHLRGLRLLLEYGAKPGGTNVLLRALDFNDHAAVELLLAHGADPNEGVADHASGQPAQVVPALHQAARRGCDARMVQILLDAGADSLATYQGMSAYVLARAFGNDAAAHVLASVTPNAAVPGDLAVFVAAIEGRVRDGQYLDPAKLPPELRGILRNLVHLPGRLDQIRQLVRVGIEYARPDDMGLTPVQIAGWEGLPEVLRYFLSLKPDLGHVNGYGGTLLSTIIHGSENAPYRADRDHVECARQVLHLGVSLPRRAVELAGAEEMSEFLTDWARRHPAQVVDHGVA